jgi:glycosyltransferase involved in cell wall biosynthesis
VNLIDGIAKEIIVINDGSTDQSQQAQVYGFSQACHARRGAGNISEAARGLCHY